MEFIKEIRQRLCIIDNIVNVCLCPGLYIPENIVNLSMDIDYQVNVAYDWDLKGFLDVIGNDGQHELMVRIKQSLVEEKSYIENS